MSANLVSVDWLSDHLHDAEVKVVDCRFHLGQSEVGYEQYKEGHIPGAFYLSLEKDMSGPKDMHGGRHPLPNLREFSTKLGTFGIDKKTKVVAYDGQGGAMASRFWWLLKFMGHQDVYVLNGGYSHWCEKGFPVTTDRPTETTAPTVFDFMPQTDMAIFIDEVKQAKDREGVVLIDSREAKRYLGLEEPIDAKAGHIPGAKNYFWKEGLKEDGTWKSAAQQKERFQALSPEDTLIVYCGSGVTACPNVLALKEAGFPKIKLYVGSWSDWSSYDENPIAVGKEKE
jgi:thiosulfate/3-mercaptopyruvate sulfurtransferase